MMGETANMLGSGTEGAKGRYCVSTMNLSGSRTMIRRNSGESIQPPTGYMDRDRSQQIRDIKLSGNGDREEAAGLFSAPFFVDSTVSCTNSYCKKHERRDDDAI